MAGLSSPVQWYGGKGIMASKIIALFPPHETFVEPFGGGASILLAKAASNIEVYNDIDAGLVNFFRVLRDPKKFQKLHALCLLTPYSRQEFNDCRKLWRETEDEIERAHQWFVVARMSFSGDFGHSNSWSRSVGMSRRSMAGAVSRYLSAIEAMPLVHERLMRVQIEQNDFRKILTQYDSERTLFYLDPPYMHETRQRQRYQYELNDKDHREMCEIILEGRGKFILSGYPNRLYETLLEPKGWKREDFATSCFAAGRTQASKLQGEGSAAESVARTESLWLSPSAQQQPSFDFDEE